MRCDDLTRELASPTGALSPDEITGHLAECSACAEWSSQAARFDRIWEATRPIEPTPAMIDALWASASAALESPATLRLEGLAVPARRNWIKPALIVASAAAILLATGIFWSRQGPVAPVQIAQNDVPVPVADPVPVIQKTPVDPVTPVENLNSSAIPSLTLVANDDEELLVSIPLDQNADPKVKRLKDSRLEQSTSIPSGTPFEIIGAVESMVDHVVVTTR